MKKRAPTFRELLDATTNHGRQSFKHVGDALHHACLRCDASFEQSEEG